MNKYQEAYSYIKHYCELDDDCVRWPLYQRSIESLKELVDKATPKKFSKKLDYSVVCPTCNHHLDKLYGRNYDYCPKCGQKLDWSDE